MHSFVSESEPAKPVFAVCQYLDAWFKDYSPLWAPNTVALNSAFNKWLMADDFRALAFPPSIDEVNAFYGQLEASPSTKHRIRKLLRSAFQGAVDEVKIPFNPCRFKSAPAKPKRGTVVSFEPEDERRLLEFVQGQPDWLPVALFAFDSGAREHELVGLQVRDFDFDRGEVHIRRTVETIRGKGPVLKEPVKTYGSRRRVQLSQATLAAVRMVLE